jgi:hypothetical protein
MICFNADTLLICVNRYVCSYAISSGSTPHTCDYGIALAQMCGLPASLIADAHSIKAHIVARATDPTRPLTSIRRQQHTQQQPQMALCDVLKDEAAVSQHMACVSMLRVAADMATRLAPLYIEVQLQLQVSEASKRSPLIWALVSYVDVLYP